MRIAYVNQIDDLTATQIVASSEVTLYAATEIKDTRLTTQWRTSSPTSQTLILNAGSGPDSDGYEGQPMFQATTNLVGAPLNFTGWNQTRCTITSTTTILGYHANLITSASAGAAYAYPTYHATASTGNTYSANIILRKGTSNIPFFRILNGSSNTVLGRADVDFNAKTVTAASGGTVYIKQWIDDETVRIGLTGSAVASAGNAIAPYVNVGNTATNETVIATMAQMTLSTYPLAYTATTRTVWATSYAHRLPPSAKFIIDTEIYPYSPYNGSTFEIANWYIDGTHYLRLFYNSAIDKISLTWGDGSLRVLTHSTVFDGGTAQTINQSIRVVASLDLSTEGITTGSRFFMLPRTQGSLQEGNSWDNAINALTSTTFTTLNMGALSATKLNGVMKYFRIYGGTISSSTSISTESDLDTALENYQLTYEQDYQGSFDFNTVAVMGHNISQEADIKVEANDWNEWNYTDGSGSSIIQQSLTWHENTPIMYFFSSIYKRQYLKFTINDPNNDDASIHIGRIWAGKYKTIDPSSELDFRVIKKRSDDVIIGKNQQMWANPNVGWRRMEFTFPPTQTTTLNIVQTMYDTVGNHTPFIFANFDTIRSYEIVEPVYCRIDGEITFTHRHYQKYAYGLNLEEVR